MLTEPLMTNFGMIPVADGFHETLRELTRRAGTVLIIDETHTLSCGPGGYTAGHGLEPDIFVAGKAIAGGIPAGIFGLSQEIAERLWKLVPHVNPRRATVRASRIRRDARWQRIDGRDHARGAGEGADLSELRAHDRGRDLAGAGSAPSDRDRRSALARHADRRARRDHVHAASAAQRST